jgi:oxalate decarboxylase
LEDSTFLITDWFNHTPKEVLAKNFGVAASQFADLPRDIDHMGPRSITWLMALS